MFLGFHWFSLVFLRCFKVVLRYLFDPIKHIKFPMQSHKPFYTICRPKISPPKVIYKVQSMPYKSLPLGAFWTIFGRNFPTGVPELLYPYQPANPLVESIFKALKFSEKKNQIHVFVCVSSWKYLQFCTENPILSTKLSKSFIRIKLFRCKKY